MDLDVVEFVFDGRPAMEGLNGQAEGGKGGMTPAEQKAALLHQFVAMQELCRRAALAMTNADDFAAAAERPMLVQVASLDAAGRIGDPRAHYAQQSQVARNFVGSAIAELLGRAKNTAQLVGIQA